MILVDTSVWIEFFRGNVGYSSALRSALIKGQIFSPECVFGELLQGAKDKREIELLAEYWGSLPKKDELGLWIEAGITASKERWYSKGVGLIDAFLILFARRHRLQIWTLDQKLNRVLHPAERFV